MDKSREYQGFMLFAQEILTIISSGEKETLTEIESHFIKCDTVQYLCSRYDVFKNHNNYITTDIEPWNKIFYDFAGYVYQNEFRKYGLREDDGLLLIIAIILDIVDVKESVYNN